VHSLPEPFPSALLASTNVPSPYDAPGAAGGPDLFIKISEFLGGGDYWPRMALPVVVRTASSWGV
jgi:hypothetical protein